MEYVWLEEKPLEEIYRNSAWRALQYFLCNTEILKDEKYQKVYSEILQFFIERRKIQFNLNYCDSSKIIDLAKNEYYSFMHNKNFSKNNIDDFVENYYQYKNLLVIRPKK